jgi:hypothetical protein
MVCSFGSTRRHNSEEQHRHINFHSYWSARTLPSGSVCWLCQTTHCIKPVCPSWSCTCINFVWNIFRCVFNEMWGKGVWSLCVCCRFFALSAVQLCVQYVNIRTLRIFEISLISTNSIWAIVGLQTILHVSVLQCCLCSVSEHRRHHAAAGCVGYRQRSLFLVARFRSHMFWLISSEVFFILCRWLPLQYLHMVHDRNHPDSYFHSHNVISSQDLSRPLGYAETGRIFTLLLLRNRKFY